MKTEFELLYSKPHFQHTNLYKKKSVSLIIRHYHNLEPASQPGNSPSIPYILDPATKLEICTVSLSFILVSLIFISHLHFTPGYYNLLWYMSCHSVPKLLFILFYIHHCIFNITSNKKMGVVLFNITPYKKMGVILVDYIIRVCLEK